LSAVAKLFLADCMTVL